VFTIAIWMQSVWKTVWASVVFHRICFVCMYGNLACSTLSYTRPNSNQWQRITERSIMMLTLDHMFPLRFSIHSSQTESFSSQLSKWFGHDFHHKPSIATGRPSTGHFSSRYMPLYLKLIIPIKFPFDDQMSIYSHEIPMKPH
jgi:hypothetical protein